MSAELSMKKFYNLGARNSHNYREWPKGPGIAITKEHIL